MAKHGKHKSWRKQLSQKGRTNGASPWGPSKNRGTRLIRLGIEREGWDTPPEDSDMKACLECRFPTPVGGGALCEECEDA